MSDDIVLSDDGRELLSTSASGRVVVPEGVCSIADKALMYSEGIEEMVLPRSLERLGEYAFAFSSLRRLEAPGHLLEIGSKAFFQCGNLEEVQLNEGLESIGDEAFAQSGLHELAIPASVRHLGRNVVRGSDIAFGGACAGLSIDTDNPFFFLDDAGALYKRGADGARLVELLAADLERHDVAEGTRFIAAGAYRSQSSLQEVRLPEGVVSIGQDAFAKCSRLHTVEFPETLERIEGGAFEGTDLRAVYLPEGFAFLGARALAVGSNKAGRHSLDVRVHPENPRFFIASDLLCQRREDGCGFAVLYLGEGPSISIPDDVVSVAPYAFAGAPSIDELHVPRSLRSIHPKSFVNDASITVYLDLGQEVCGRSYAVFRNVGPLMLLYTSLEGGIDVELLFDICDYNASRTNDYYELGRYAVERFECPQYLTDANRNRLQEALAKRIVSVVRGLGEHGDTETVNALADWDALNVENITEVIESLADVDDAAVMGCLLEIKHRRLGRRTMDFSL